LKSPFQRWRRNHRLREKNFVFAGSAHDHELFGIEATDAATRCIDDFVI
jgi:hypothetical protein